MKKILIVDDEKEFLYLVEQMLKDAGFEAIGATSGKDALKKAQEDHPDLIMLDIMLPDIDGATVYRKLKENGITSEIPIIFISGVFSKEDAMRDKDFLHGKVFFTKPFDDKKLIDEINKLV
ncbi:MAG: response regulator transcription factor [Candidatus Omnitrophota bacterium]